VSSFAWVLQQISYAFQQCKNFEDQLRLDKVTDSLKVGTFLIQSVETILIYIFYHFRLIMSYLPKVANFNQTHLHLVSLFGVTRFEFC